MKRRLWIFSILTTILFLCISAVVTPITIQAAEPSIDFSVKSSANEYTLNTNGEAKGSLEIEVTPNGVISPTEREPIDVVFLYNTAGSMDAKKAKKNS